MGKPVEIVKQTFSAHRRKPVKRISFVAGLHGNELEGVYLCCLLIDTLKNLQDSRPEAFQGEINIYPAVNPQAIDAGTRLWPFFSTDMNRLMGDGTGNSLPEETARVLLEDLEACSDLAVDFHASNLHLK
ncbi:MAG: succinylglutamate desuccinylase/aspartoacylase family protein, partial [Nitrospinaceae bacterium]